MTSYRKSKHNIKRIEPPFCGESFLNDLTSAVEKIYKKGSKREYMIDRDKALIAALFLTGARPSEVVKLRKSSFDFDNKEAKKNNAFLVKEFILMKHGTKGLRTHIAREFPIWRDDPLVEHLIKCYNQADDYLFPSPLKGYPQLSYFHANRLAKMVGNNLPETRYIIPLWFRRQREFYLAEKKGFSISNIKAYMKLDQIQETPTKRKEWQNLLVIATDFHKAMFPEKKFPETLIIDEETINPLMLFDLLDLHPIIVRASKSQFKSGHYTEAIFNAFKCIEIFAKQKSGSHSRGTALMQEIFSEKHPIIKLNNMQQDFEIDEQNGFRFIYAGAMLGIRNPNAHADIQQKDPYRTLEYLSLASLLAKRLEEGTKVE